MRVFLFCLFFCLDFFLGGGVKDLGYGCLLPTLSKTMLHTCTGNMGKQQEALVITHRTGSCVNRITSEVPHTCMAGLRK